jgi:hypothetical protein
MDIVNDIVWLSFLLFIWSGSVAAILIGISMLIAPGKTTEINRYFSRWFSTHKGEEVLDRPRWLERHLYRYHRLVGVALLAGSLFVLHAFLLRPIRQKISSLPINDVLDLLDAGVALFVIGGVVGAIVGGIMLFKPSLLRDIEAASNRWTSSKELMDAFNRTHMMLDPSLSGRRTWIAAILILGGGYVLVRLGTVLLVGKWQL